MTTPAQAPRSNFVTVLAWLMIAFGALGVLMSLMQLVLVSLLLPALQGGLPLPPPFGELSLAFLRVAMLLGIAFSAFMTWSAWALLQRRNWARLLFIVLFIAGAVMHLLALAGFGAGFGLLGSLPADSEFLPPEFQQGIHTMMLVLGVFLLVMTVGYAWMAYRLCTPAIAAEFSTAE